MEYKEALGEQLLLKNIEKLGGNIVKEEFHKGAIFGMKLAKSIIVAEIRAIQEPTPELLNLINKIIDKGLNRMAIFDVVQDEIADHIEASDT